MTLSVAQNLANTLDDSLQVKQHDPRRAVPVKRPHSETSQHRDHIFNHSVTKKQPYVPTPEDIALRQGKLKASERYPGYFPPALGGPKSPKPDHADYPKFREFLRTNDLCYYCKRSGHRLADCPAKGPTKN